MSRFTLDELRTIMRDSAGVDESVDLDADIADVPFEDLGYDSLAVLELTSKVSQRYAISVPDDAVAELTTPGRAVQRVNDWLAGV